VAAAAVSPGRVVTSAVVDAAAVVSFVLPLQAENAKIKVNSSKDAISFLVDNSPFTDCLN
jgi:hypothetical protein